MAEQNSQLDPMSIPIGRGVAVASTVAIDVSNLEEVVWALITRSDPATSIDIIRNAWSKPLDPRIEPERKAVGDNTNSRAIIDACRPWHWREKFPAVNAPSPEERSAALQKFGYLFKK
jgi:3-polyprenyl-4-hydroxybenzoate decarboxylase